MNSNDSMITYEKYDAVSKREKSHQNWSVENVKLSGETIDPHREYIGFPIHDILFIYFFDAEWTSHSYDGINH
jgi:hypothetical protein